MSIRIDSLLHYLRRPSRRRLERVVREYHEHVWKVAFRVTAHAEDAEDICQDVFLRLFLKPPSADDVRSAHGYLAWCVIGRASKLRRSAERRVAREREAAARMVGSELALEDAEAMRVEIDRLPDELRVPLELRYVAGLGNAEVASMLGLPPRTLEQRLHDGRERLKRRLAPLFLGLPAAVDSLMAAMPPPPPQLLSDLLRVVQSGAALSPASAVGIGVISGGVVMTKKAVAIGAFLLLLASLTGYRVLWREEAPKPPTGPVAGAPARSATQTAPAPQEIPTNVSNEEPQLRPEPPRASLRGVVKDETGAVLAGATVRFVDNIPAEDVTRLQALGYRDVVLGMVEHETTTDASGEYSFTDLLPGRAHVGARVPGLAAGSPAVELESGKTAWQLLSLRYLRRLSGRVTDEEGRALRGAAVLVRSARVIGVEDLARIGKIDSNYVIFAADEFGVFDTEFCLFDRFPASGQELLAWADGFAMDLEGRPREGDSPYNGTVDFILKPEMPIEVWVGDPQGHGIGEVEVGCGSGDGICGWIPYPLCTTDDSGRARVEHLERKQQRLFLARKGYHTAGVEIGPESPRELRVTLAPVEEPELGAEITVDLRYEEPFPELVQSWGELTLDRETAVGEPVKALPRQHRSKNRSRNAGDPLRSSLDHKVPRVVFRPVESGRYRCRLVFRHGGEVIGQPFDHDARHPRTVEVPVAVPAPYIAGSLVDAATRAPIANRTVWAHYHPRDQPPVTWTEGTLHGGVPFPHMAGAHGACETDANGRFLILLPGNECPLTVSVGLGEVRTGWARADEIEVNANSKVEDLRLELRPGGAITGQVVSESGAPIAGEMVVVYDGGATLDRKMSDAEGKFGFEGLRPGAYALEALGVLASSKVGNASGGEGFEPGLPTPEEVFDRNVDVVEGEATSWTIVLERDRLGAIEGVLAEGLPRTGEVEHKVLLRGEPRHVLGWAGSTVVRDGAFRCANLHAGRYRVTFHAPGIVAEAAVDVRRGHVARVVLEPAFGTLSIPLPPLLEPVAAELQVSVVQRRGRAARSAEENGEPWHWEESTGHRVEKQGGAIVILGLPSGVWRAKVESPHLPDAWSEEASVEDGLPTVTPPLVFSKPCSARLRVELEDGSAAPADARVSVHGPRGGVTCRIEPSPDDPGLRLLSNLPVGEHRVGAEWQGLGAEDTLAIREDEVPEVRIVLKR